MVRFRSVLKRYESDELNQIEAAEMLGVSERTFRRWCRRFDGEGEAGLLDRRLGRASPKRMPPDDEAEIERLYRTRYQGFTAVHFHEHLTHDHLHRWSYTRVKQLLQAKGLLEKAPRRGVHRRKRPRRPLPGMMLHQDGSRHAWLVGQAALDLIVTMDDATSEIYSAFLTEEEGTDSTFCALLEVFGRQGLPLSLYTDRGSHYFHTPEAGGKVDRGQPTQVGRALAQLSVEHIAAYSPEARGRSERMFRTLQGRLPKEMSLAGIATVEAANAWLRDTYIPSHNARFAAKAEQAGSAFAAAAGLDLAETLCVQEARIVGNDNCVSFGGRRLQIPESPLRPHFVKATVKVHRYPDGRLAVFHGRRCLGRYACDGTPAVEPAAVAGDLPVGDLPVGDLPVGDLPVGDLPVGDLPVGDLPVGSRPATRVASRTATVKDASRRASAVASPSLTAPARDAMARSRSAPGNGPDSLTRIYPLGTPLLQQTKRQRADT